MEDSGPKIRICQRTITISKVTKSGHDYNGYPVLNTHIFIDGMMDFNIGELREIKTLIEHTIDDLEHNFYG